MPEAGHGFVSGDSRPENIHELLIHLSACRRIGFLPEAVAHFSLTEIRVGDGPEVVAHCQSRSAVVQCQIVLNFKEQLHARTEALEGPRALSFQRSLGPHNMTFEHV